MQLLRPSAAAAQETRATIHLALPLIVGGLLTMGMNTTDVVLAGHLGAGVLGAVAVGAALFHLANVAAFGINAAIAPSVAQLDGAARRGEVGHLFTHALVISLTAGLVLGTILYIAAPRLAAHLGLAVDVLPQAAAFLHAVAAAIPALSLFYACRGLSEGLSRPGPTMAF